MLQTWPRLIFLDFDGVIVDSSGIKYDCFLAATAALAPQLTEYLATALTGELVGAERLRVGEWIERLSSGVVKKERFLELFANTLAANSNKIELVAGFREFLFRAASHAALYIVSAAPLADIVGTLARLGTRSQEFQGIFGSEDGSKTKVIAAILTENKKSAVDAVFVGDMPSDLAVAQALKMPFVRIESFGGALCPWPEGSYRSYKNFAESDWLSPSTSVSIKGET